MCSLAAGTHLEPPPSTATVQFCNVVCVLMSRCLRPEAPLPLCHIGKQQNALCVLNAAPRSSLFSHCRCANVSSVLISELDSEGGANGRPRTDNLDWWQSFLITLIRCVLSSTDTAACRLVTFRHTSQFRFCSPQRNGFCEHPVLSTSNSQLTLFCFIAFYLRCIQTRRGLN